MKRIGTILSLSVLIVLLASSFSFAKGLTLESIYPKEGEKGLQPNNVAVKLKFSENVTGKEAQDANKDCFKITGPKGKEIKYDVLYNPQKYPNEIWLQMKETLEADTKYTLTISEELQSSAGNTLDAPITSHYSIRDTKQDSKGYMILMFLMIGGMMVYTAIDTKRKVKKETEGKEEEIKVNPYKESKRTGKTVEEIVAKAEKEKKARAKKNRNKKPDSEETEEVREGVKRVKERRPISAIGTPTPKRVIAMRKAREEAQAKAEAEEEARANANKKKASGKKGSKQHRKKK